MNTNGINNPSSNLTHAGLKTANYTAKPNEHVQGNVAGGEFAITLPPNPADGTIVQVQNFTQTDTTNILEAKTSAGDFIAVNPGPTSVYLELFLQVITFNFDKSDRTWEIENTAPPGAFAIGFPGISARTPIVAADLSFDLDTRIMTITPPLVQAVH